MLLIFWWQHLCMFEIQSTAWLRASHNFFFGARCRDSLRVPPRHATSTHTQPFAFSAWDMEMGAAARALVWRPVLVELHISGLPGALWTSQRAQRHQRAGVRSAALLWTPPTGWFLMVENAYQTHRHISLSLKNHLKKKPQCSLRHWVSSDATLPLQWSDTDMANASSGVWWAHCVSVYGFTNCCGTGWQ